MRYRVTWPCVLAGFIRVYIGVSETDGASWNPLEWYFQGGEFQYLNQRPAYLLDK
jgi:hypothetical protein